MTSPQPNDPLHGVSLKTIVTQLVEHYGWEELEEHFRFDCFLHDPSIKSTLKFLRKTAWARDKVEAFYVRRFS